MKRQLTSVFALAASCAFAQLTPMGQQNELVKLLDAPLQVPVPKNAYGLPAYDSRKLLVAFHANTPFSSRRKLVANFGLREDQFALNPYFSRLIAPEGADVIQIIAELKNDPSVRIAEPDYIVTANATPNDPSFSSLWGLRDTSAPDADVNAESAWDISTGSLNVRVCVIDTGIQYTHPDLAANYLVNPGETAGNGIDDDANGYIDDVYGWDFVNNDNNPDDDNSHGTHCAGTVGAKGNNGIGVVGVSWTVSMFAAKFLSAGGSGSTSNGILSIDYARIRGAHIMSNSWGGGGFSRLQREAIERAEVANILFVAAAGNSSNNNDYVVNYPSSYDVPNVMAVASHTSSDDLSGFSSYGLDTVDISAPGSSVFSTIPGSSYGTKSGTSMATPHVAGAAALVKAVFPAAGYSFLKTRLMDAAVRVPAYEYKVQSGRLDVRRAIETDTVAPGTPTNLVALKRSFSTLQGTITCSGDDGATGTVSSLDLRFSQSPINAGNFAGATPIAADPQPGSPGAIKNFIVPGLTPGRTYYLGARAVDNNGNVSGVVSAGPYTTLSATSQDDFEGAASMTVSSGSWATSASANSGVKSWTDSPAGNYGNSQDVNLRKTAAMAITQPSALVFSSKFDLEYQADYVDVEVSTNGTTWSAVRRLTGNQPNWRTSWINLTPYVGQNLQVRFRLRTDSSSTRDGIYLDDLGLVPLASLPLDNFDGAATFTGESPWATTTARAVSPANSWTDSPAGDYANNVEHDLTQNSTFSLANLANPSVTFNIWYELENGYDFLRVLSSPDNSGFYVDYGRFTGVNAAWNYATIPMVGIGNTKLRFRLDTDAGAVDDGAYLDNLMLIGENLEAIPTTATYAGTVTWQGLGDPVGKQVVVDFRTPGTSTVVSSSTVTLGAGGSYTANIAPGTYDVAYRGDRTLTRVLANRVLGSGGLSGQNASLLTADIVDDNIVDIADYTALAGAFSATPSSGSWNALADLNFDGIIDIADYTLLAGNFSLTGD